jgi:transcriptional regulator with XRE-family HTH domain
MEPVEITNKTIGNNIRKHRMSKQIKQEYLAKKTGLSVSEISRIENGQRDTSVNKLLRIASALKIQPADLIKTWFPLLISVSV